MIPIEYIDDQQKLLHCEKHLNGVSEFSFDLEFDNNHYSYGITMCLIQISTADKCFVIDTLQPMDLSNLFKIFESKNILKICFSPDQDLKLLHSLNCRPLNIFDAAVAGKLLNYQAAGLGAVLETKFQLQLDKKLQKSNWSKRPLSPEQIRYSAEDVMHLIPLKNIYEEEAKQKGILPWLEEENELLNSFTSEEKGADDFLNRKDRESLSEHTLYALNELLRYANALGKKINKPVGWLINKQVLIDLIRDRMSIQELANLRGIHPSFKGQDFKQHYEKTLQETNDKNLSKRSGNPKPSFEERQENIRQKAKAQAMKEKMFYPIRKLIGEKYGEFAAEYIFGEPQMNQLASGKTKISGFKMQYRIELINSAAKELKIDLNGYC